VDNFDTHCQKYVTREARSSMSNTLSPQQKKAGLPRKCGTGLPLPALSVVRWLLTDSLALVALWLFLVTLYLWLEILGFSAY
jgi:hypothetical protein